MSTTTSEFLPGMMAETFFRDVPRRTGFRPPPGVMVDRAYAKRLYAPRKPTAADREESLQHLLEWRMAYEADRRARGVPPSGLRRPVSKVQP